ncbi:MAG: NAD-dependent epimerase/dehydratase family protein [Promethearchaeota archaeon]
MRHLVLGSSGQIGSYLVKYLNRLGEDVLEFDIKHNDKEDLRIHNNEILHQKMNECDFVHFLAFDIGGSRYMHKYQETFNFIDNNMKIMVNTFDLLKKMNKPFIFASSQMSNMMNSNYGKLKSIGESYSNILNGVTVKFWNVYGYEKDPEKFHVITDFIYKARDNNRIDMLTNGEEERQFLYATDAAECLYVLSKKYKELNKNRDYHVTSFKWTSIINIAKLISTHFQNCPIYPAYKKDTIQLKKNEPDNYILKYWKPKVGLHEGIKKVIKSIEEEKIVL